MVDMTLFFYCRKFEDGAALVCFAWQKCGRWKIWSVGRIREMLRFHCKGRVLQIRMPGFAYVFPRKKITREKLE